MPDVTASPRPVRLLVVDDHTVMRSGLANMLNEQDDFQVVAEVGNGKAALQAYDEFLPDVTLMDVVMPVMGGLECLEKLRAKHADATVLMLSSSELEHDLARAMELDADGYITKTAMPNELMHSIRTVHRGDTYISNDVSRRLRHCEITSQLSPREKEVLDLLRLGMSNPEIGQELEITTRTAKAHVAAILLKLHAKDRAEAVARGFEKGLLRHEL